MKKKLSKEEKRLQGRLKWLMENGYTENQAKKILGINKTLS
jgi:hypothetical protein